MTTRGPVKEFYDWGFSLGKEGKTLTLWSERTVGEPSVRKDFFEHKDSSARVYSGGEVSKAGKDVYEIRGVEEGPSGISFKVHIDPESKK